MSTMAYCYHSLNMYLEMKEETDDMKRSVKMLFGLAFGSYNWLNVFDRIGDNGIAIMWMCWDGNRIDFGH